METGFQRAARKRWPQATIEGDGSFAVVVYCYPAKGVRLFHTYLEAAPLVSERCPHAFCKLEHKLSRIQPLEETQPQYQAAHSCGYAD